MSAPRSTWDCGVDKPSGRHSSPRSLIGPAGQHPARPSPKREGSLSPWLAALCPSTHMRLRYGCRPTSCGHHTHLRRKCGARTLSCASRGIPDAAQSIPPPPHTLGGRSSFLCLYQRAPPLGSVRPPVFLHACHPATSGRWFTVMGGGGAPACSSCCAARFIVPRDFPPHSPGVRAQPQHGHRRCPPHTHPALLASFPGRGGTDPPA